MSISSDEGSIGAAPIVLTQGGWGSTDYQLPRQTVLVNNNHAQLYLFVRLPLFVQNIA